MSGAGRPGFEVNVVGLRRWWASLRRRPSARTKVAVALPGEADLWGQGVRPRMRWGARRDRERVYDSRPERLLDCHVLATFPFHGRISSRRLDDSEVVCHHIRRLLLSREGERRRSAIGDARCCALAS